MISRLTVFIAAINLALSGLVIYNIVHIQQQTKEYKAEPITINVKSNVKSASDTDSTVIEKQPTTNTSSATKNNTTNPTTTPASQTKPESPAASETEKSSTMKNYNLTEEELYKLLSSHDPFGQSLSKNEEQQLKENIQNQAIEASQASQSTQSGTTTQTNPVSNTAGTGTSP